MEKKIVYPLIGAAILVLFIGGTVFIIEYNKSKKTKSLLEEALELLREGRYEEGLDRCNQMAYRRGVCHVTLLGLKLGRNETITTQFCDSFPTDDTEPFWLPGKTEFHKRMKDMQNQCYGFVS